MRIFFLSILFISHLLYAQDISSLLEELESNNEASLYTVDEKLGHVSIYSQKDLRLMQYTTISDLFKELSLSNLNKNRFGVANLSLPGSKTNVSGFFRIFINDHEISSSYSLSASPAWMNLPMDLIEYIEVYRGDSSFSLGSDNGVFFIRIYTKDAAKENAAELSTTIAYSGSNTQSASYADTLENGWSYLAYFNNTSKKDSITYKENEILNDSETQFFYVNVKNQDIDINAGYTQLRKDNYFGFSLDANPDDGEISSKDYFIDVTSYFLDDNSLKLKLSYDVNQFTYDESNKEGIAFIPILDLSDISSTILQDFKYKNQLQKSTALLSKTFSFADNNLLIGLSYQNKKYITKQNTAVNLANIKTDAGQFTDFDKEQMYSLFFQDDYKLTDQLLFVLNAKVDKYKRDGYLDDYTDTQYRIGAVYNINENFGLKSFYSRTFISPSFSNIDYAAPDSSDMQNQKYNVFSIEGVYAKENSRFSMLYSKVKIKDFIYYTPIGFTNIPHTISSENYSIDYTYTILQDNKISLNYFISKLGEQINNSNKGGYIKFTGACNSFEYFSSLIYRNAYQYLDTSVDDTYNFNIGLAYNISKDISMGIKVENLFDNSTESLYQEGFPSNDFALEDYQRDVTFNMKWVF